MTPIKLAIVMDPIEQIEVKKDSSLAMLLAAQRRDWQLTYFTQENLFQDGCCPRGIGQPLKVADSPQDYFQLAAQKQYDLRDFNVILMRKDPPFDRQFLYTTYLLESAQRGGALVVNRPSSLRDCNEKIFATEFPQCCPALRITANAEQIKEFHREHRDIILKPLDGMGGSSVFRVKENDKNLNVIIETLTNHQRRSIMAQRYLAEIVDGDKRILLIDGEPIDYALARIPSHGESRGNLAAGGRGEAIALTDRDRWICQQVGPALKEKGLLFVGIDVIGDYLTEINVTSPTCIRELDSQCNLDIAGQLMDAIAGKLSER